MKIDLSGKVALVTGGSRGIGRAVALSLAESGADVALTYASNEAAAKEVVAEIEKRGGKAQAIHLDVVDSAATKKVIDDLAKAKGGIHILVANAGIAIDGLVMRMKDDDLDKLFRTNVFGAYYAARSVVFPMMKARFGRIIFLGSVVGEMGNAGQSAYAGTKSAMEGIAKSLARELASRNITANVVAPGFIETDMTTKIPEEARKALLASIPLGEIGKPEDIADAITFLCSEKARYITGQTLHVNGGLSM
ncbi:MAG: 3-oxoacyl-[acyl-carrier-protein] reductase [Myxococcota bacterium]